MTNPETGANVTNLPGKSAPGKFTKAQEDARRYVEGNGLERFIAQILNGLVQARPNKPRIWMIKYLAERCTAQELQEAGISVKGLHKAVIRAPSPRHGEQEPGLALAPASSNATMERRDSVQSLRPPASPGEKPPGSAGSSGRGSRKQKEDEGEQVQATATATPPKMAGGGGERESGSASSPKPGSREREAAGAGETAEPREGSANEEPLPRKEISPEKEGEPGGAPESTAGTGDEASSIREEWRGVQSWEEFQQKLASGLPMPTPVQEAAVPREPALGGPRWLAEQLAREPTQALTRLQELSESRGSFLHQADTDRHNLAMALAVRMGAGPWIDYLTERGICTQGAQDLAGNTVEDYARKFASVAAARELGGEPGGPEGAGLSGVEPGGGGGGGGVSGDRSADSAGEEFGSSGADVTKPSVSLGELRAAFDKADADAGLLDQEPAMAVFQFFGLPNDAAGDPSGWEDGRISFDQMLMALRARGLVRAEDSSPGTDAAAPASGGAAEPEDDGGV